MLLLLMCVHSPRLTLPVVATVIQPGDCLSFHSLEHRNKYVLPLSSWCRHLTFVCVCVCVCETERESASSELVKEVSLWSLKFEKYLAKKIRRTFRSRADTAICPWTSVLPKSTAMSVCSHRLKQDTRNDKWKGTKFVFALWWRLCISAVWCEYTVGVSSNGQSTPDGGQKRKATNILLNSLYFISPHPGH